MRNNKTPAMRVVLLLPLHFLFLLCPVFLVQEVHRFLENYFSYCSLCHEALLNLVVSFLLLPFYHLSRSIAGKGKSYTVFLAQYQLFMLQG